MAKVSIILPTRNEQDGIANLLESIFSQEFDGDIEVLVMDSSDDSTPEIARTFPVRIVRVEPEDYNYGKTRNEGASMTDGDLLVFISADVGIRGKTWLAKLTRHFSDPRVAGAYGRQIPRNSASPLQQFFILRTYPAETKILKFEGTEPRLGMVFFSNTNSAIRRSVWQQIKIPEMLKSEDQEWAKRALLAGFTVVYDADAGVYHSNEYSAKSVFHEYFDSGAAMPAIYDDGAAGYSIAGFVRDGIRYVLDEHKFLVKRGHWHWIPRALIYDIAKFSGVFLGSKQRYMPLWMKKALCKKKNHWDRYSDVIKEPA